MIIEISSPSNQSHDLVFKLNLYMQYGVKEYWIVNPLLKTIQQYVLDENSEFRLEDIAKDEGTVTSTIVPGFSVDVKKVFSE